VLCCQLTPETEGLIGESELHAMKPSAFLRNVSRGEVVNEPVLKRALAEGWIAGAGLDVFWNEPLEEESELWDMPNVVMTSHRAGRSVRQEERSTSVFEDNLDRYLADQPLTNVAKSYDEA
ncbi:MAG: D-2-hydroxyacid dehydrogenase, partial [Chloroflexi bacterium]|nr:D-2-hydroxyacid dehydrogenase [Chloroflexota bacterium]